jgi:hypothetical protein
MGEIPSPLIDLLSSESFTDSMARDSLLRPAVADKYTHYVKYAFESGEHVLDEILRHVENPRLIATGPQDESFAPPFFRYASGEALALFDRPFKTVVKHRVAIGE